MQARGAAVGNTKIGYKRRPTVPATETEPAKGPFYDVIDPEKASIIREVFERIAAGETSAEVGEWLDSIKFAKAKWSRQSKWTTYNVNSIIRRTIYRGFETNRVKVEKRKLRTGKSQPVWNDEDKIQTRESPHLRIVSDHLWYKANEVVESIETLKGRGPKDLEDLSVRLTARMLVLAGLTSDDAEAERRVREALTSGAGVERFRGIIEEQGGDPRVIDDYALLPSARMHVDVLASQSGYLGGLDAELVGRAAVLLGAGRERVDSVIDPGVGIDIRLASGAAPSTRTLRDVSKGPSSSAINPSWPPSLLESTGRSTRASTCFCSLSNCTHHDFFTRALALPSPLRPDGSSPRNRALFWPLNL